MRNLTAKVSLVVLALSLAQIHLKAQDASSLTGVVTDSTGAVVPDTLVTLSNTLTGVGRHLRHAVERAGKRFAEGKRGKAKPGRGRPLRDPHAGAPSFFN